MNDHGEQPGRGMSDAADVSAETAAASNFEESELDLVDPGSPSGLDDFARRVSPEQTKENSAQLVAGVIVLTFGVTVLAALVGGFLIIIWRNPAEVKGVVNDAAIPLLKEITGFATTVFGPLLAFVLGYYFGERGGSDGRSRG